MDPVLAGRTGPRHAGGPRVHPFLAAVLAAGLTAVLTAVLTVTGLGGPVLIGRAALPTSRPGLPVDAAAAPLGRPETAPAGAGGYRFLNTQDDGSGRPVRWDPCRPIHYVLRDDGAPPGGDAALRAAIAEIERVSGLRFVADGTSTEVPRPERPLLQITRHGRRWAPVLVAWTDPGEYPALSGFAGLAGGDPVGGSRPGTQRYVSGVLLLNREHLRAVAGWPGGQQRIRAVIRHELGHLIGLDHVDDPHQLMYSEPTSLTGDLADGDRRGLAALADGPCFRDF